MNEKEKRKCPDTRLFLKGRDITSLQLVAVAISTGVENRICTSCYSAYTTAL